jgi:hypothetical protein
MDRVSEFQGQIVDLGHALPPSRLPFLVQVENTASTAASTASGWRMRSGSATLSEHGDGREGAVAAA